MRSEEPLGVPSEALDFTPRELWPLIRRVYRSGTVMPATVPRKIWDAHWRRKHPELGKKADAPPPPPFVKSYWGKLRGCALSSRKKKTVKDEEDSAMPPVWPPYFPDEFWESYFEMFPEGHPAPASGEYVPWKPEEEPKKYAVIQGSLHVNIGKNPEFPIWRASTGVDAFDAQGNWVGAG